jgi:hypothetical protein
VKKGQKTEMSKQEERKINFFIDKEKFETDQAQLSVQTLLVDFAKEDPQTTLALRHGNDIVKFTNLDQLIAMENGMHFIVYHNTPTPVS